MSNTIRNDVRELKNDIRELKIEELEVVSAGMRKSAGNSTTGQTFLAFKFEPVAK